MIDIMINDVVFMLFWLFLKDLIEVDLVDGKINLSLYVEVFE